MSSQTIIKHKLRKSLLWKNFTIGQIIGTGTYGTCFSCIESTKNRVFAVKIIKFNGSAAQQIKINTEIDLLEGLSKYPFEKHLFPIFYGYVYYITQPSKERFYALVFEKADGDLKSYVDKNGRGLNYKENLQLLGCLGHCLEFFSKQRIIHGDLKPENILYFINEDQEIEFKIADFGEGKLNVGSKISVRGSARYFAPEMNYGYLNRKKMVKPDKIDVYSAGLIIIWANLRGLECFESKEDKNMRGKEKFCNPREEDVGPYDEKLKIAMKETVDRFPQISEEEKIILGKILKHSLEYNPPKRCDSQKLKERIQRLITLSDSKQESQENSRSVEYSHKKVRKLQEILLKILIFFLRIALRETLIQQKSIISTNPLTKQLWPARSFPLIV